MNGEWMDIRKDGWMNGYKSWINGEWMDIKDGEWWIDEYKMNEWLLDRYKRWINGEWMGRWIRCVHEVTVKKYIFQTASALNNIRQCYILMFITVFFLKIRTRIKKYVELKCTKSSSCVTWCDIITRISWHNTAQY